MAGLAVSTSTRGVFVLADISGYTAFLQGVGNAHGEQMAAMPEVPAAYQLMTTLLDGIVERLVPPFRLSKLEGDAVFAYAPDDRFELRGASVLECMKRCYADYRERRDKTENRLLCHCSACSRLPTLELKFVLHRGYYVAQSIAGHGELMGPDVTMAHLLLKNNVKNLLGSAAYALFTEAATQYFEIPLDGSVLHTEHYEHYPPITSHVFTL